MKQLKQFPKIEQIYCNLLQNGIEEDQIEINSVGHYVQ